MQNVIRVNILKQYGMFFYTGQKGLLARMISGRMDRRAGNCGGMESTNLGVGMAKGRARRAPGRGNGAGSPMGRAACARI